MGKLDKSAIAGAMLAGLSLDPALAEAETQAELQGLSTDFSAYCEPIANREILETVLTKENTVGTVPPIFDENGQLNPNGADALPRYFADGISEACDTDDIGAYVMQYGGRVELAIYPPGSVPAPVPEAQMEVIADEYAQCLDEGTEIAKLVEDPIVKEQVFGVTQDMCDEGLSYDIKTAQAKEGTRLAQERVLLAKAEQEAITQSLIEDALEEAGLK